MIYLQEILNLTPATPETRDSFIEIGKNILVPACKRLGTRLVMAGISRHEWFSQITHIFEFADMKSLKEFRIKASQDKQWGEYMAELDIFAPERRTRLLEPIGAISPDVLNKAIEESQKTALKTYSFASLGVAPNKMTEFVEFVRDLSINAPIIASWRPIAGDPNEVNDLWKGDVGPQVAQPAVEGLKGWFRKLRELAPKERLTQIYPLPYSELK